MHQVENPFQSTLQALLHNFPSFLVEMPNHQIKLQVVMHRQLCLTQMEMYPNRGPSPQTPLKKYKERAQLAQLTKTSLMQCTILYVILCYIFISYINLFQQVVDYLVNTMMQQMDTHGMGKVSIQAFTSYAVKQPHLLFLLDFMNTLF